MPLKSFRKRIFFSFLLALLPVLILLSASVELLIARPLNRYSQQQLLNSVKTLSQMIRSSASLAIKNNLKAIAEQNREIVSHHMNLVDQGLISLETAKDRLRKILLSQRVGDSGYVYCVNSSGVAVVHPNKGVENVNFSSMKFIQEQIRRKEGYLEYNWKNPEDSEKRPKALYMVYYEPLDWIISAASYRSEFTSLLNPDDLRQTVLSLRSGQEGYAYITDKSGQAVVHPKFDKRYNLLKKSRQAVDFHLEMVKRKSGIIRYKWRNPDETRPRKKIAAFEHIPEFGWIVVSTAYVSEVNSLNRALRGIAHGAIVLLIIMGGVASYYLSGRLSRPMETMIRQLDQNSRKKIHAPLKIRGQDEFSRLAVEFNSYLAILKRQNREIWQERQRYRGLFETSPDGIMLIKNTTIVDCNPAALEIFNCSTTQLNGKTILDISPEHQPDNVPSAVRVQEKRVHDQEHHSEPQRFNWFFLRMDGEQFEAHVSLKRIRIEDGTPLLLCLVQDVTEHRRLEAMLQQAQKMEAIGTLSGGLAHDFNNLLTGILGRVELMREDLPPDDTLTEHIQAIESHVSSASGLTRQLLGFSRRGKYKVTVLDTNELVKETIEMFGRTRKDIQISVDLGNQALCTQADRQQLEQVLLNLFVNAWQAMKGDGHLRVTTDLITPDRAICESHDVTPGMFVKIQVQDNGAGMDRSTLEKIFDPFFTTKKRDRGTGLGLASAYGIVKNHGGFITVESRIGQGSTFEVYLPRSMDTIAPPTGKLPAPVKKGKGTLVVVDDEAMILDTTKRMLAHLGYDVVCARGGRKGIEQVKELNDTVDLVILDMIMPEFDGFKTFARLRKINPDLPVVLASGYAIDDQIRSLLKQGNTRFIQKPYTMADLSVLIRESLSGHS